MSIDSIFFYLHPRFYRYKGNAQRHEQEVYLLVVSGYTLLDAPFHLFHLKSTVFYKDTIFKFRNEKK